MRHIPKPAPGEYAPYTTMYFDLIPDDGQVLAHLAANLGKMRDLVSGMSATQSTTPHAPGEWTVNEILCHIIDDERIFTYRALRFARGDSTELPGFEQDDYVPPSQANDRSLESILAEHEAVRQSTIMLFTHLPEAALTRTGVASGNPLSVRAAAYHIAGHEMHHYNSIRENYLE